MRFANRVLCEEDDSSDIAASILSHVRRHVPAWVLLFECKRMCRGSVERTRRLVDGDAGLKVM